MRKNGGWLVAVALALGCRSPETIVPVVTQEHDPVESEQDRAEARESEPAAATDPVRAAGPIESATPPEPQAWVPIALPFPPEAAVLRPVLDVSPVVLFPDEGDAIRRGVAKALGARGIPLVPVEALERIEAAAAEGRLLLEGDRACRAPLLPHELVARYFSARRFVEIEAGCIDGCRLQASLQDPTDADVYVGFASRRVARIHDPRAWIAVADELRDEQSWGGIGLGMIGMSHPPPIRFDFPQGVGPWARPVEELSFEEAERVAAACAHPDPLVGFTYEVRASVDRRGAQLRCVASAGHTMVRSADGACICEALERLAVPKGASGRRFRVQAVDDGGFRGSRATLEVVQAGTEAWIRRLDESPALDRCLRVASLPKGLDAMITVSMELDGAVTGVRIDGDITTQDSMQFAQCMVQELRAVALPCAPPGIDRLQARLSVAPP
ncbi:hypothetical protein [Paraliomyxa miuraensis]|uniref:hypothetical protein n=1 Tax=Paraliomyxa miuraensis TaxID=376150 RepID=UPI0022574A9A|nr:hypothetical protein [Paraliomyxa miuraensis]MCX4243854.1 hypothetical protein [Paraliomyxa miuraensis]